MRIERGTDLTVDPSAQGPQQKAQLDADLNAVFRHGH